MCPLPLYGIVTGQSQTNHGAAQTLMQWAEGRSTADRKAVATVVIATVVYFSIYCTELGSNALALFQHTSGVHFRSYSARVW